MAHKEKKAKTSAIGVHVTSTIESSRPISIKETPRPKWFTRDNYIAALRRVSQPQSEKE